MYGILKSEGSPIGFRPREHSYASGTWDVFWYEKNLQGDVISVYNNAGTKLVSYKYDARGNFSKTSHNSGSSTRGWYNPITYRGYYYDGDLSFYVLGTRYYDPATGRFLSPDAYDVVSVTPMALTDKNLYAYCDNNPVVREDGDGEFWTAILIGAAIGAVINASVSVISQKITRRNVNWVEVGISAVAGALSGAIATTGIGALGAGAINAAIDGTEYLVTQSINGEAIDETMFFATMVVSGITAGKGLNYPKLKGVYKQSQKVLATAVSPKKIAMYSAKLTNVKKDIGRYLLDAARDGAIAIGYNWTVNQHTVDQWGFMR